LTRSCMLCVSTVVFLVFFFSFLSSHSVHSSSSSFIPSSQTAILPENNLIATSLFSTPPHSTPTLRCLSAPLVEALSRRSRLTLVALLLLPVHIQHITSIQYRKQRVIRQQLQQQQRSLPAGTRHCAHPMSSNVKTAPPETAQVGDYIVEYEIGRGSFATVYKGFHKVYLKSFALAIACSSSGCSPDAKRKI
jgi:hypothetical protein